MKEESLIKVMNFLKSLFKSKKQDIDSFYSMLNQSEWKNFIGNDEVKMIKGVIEVSELEVKDIMIPRSNMILLETSHSFDELLRTIIDSGHSRFPVIADNKDEVVGILLAKDLLKFSKERKLERLLIEDFIETIEIIVNNINKENYSIMLNLAKLPLMVRGFGHVKIKNIENYYNQKEEILTKLNKDNSKLNAA